MAITVTERIGSRGSQLGTTNRARLELQAICTSTDIGNVTGVEAAFVSFLSSNFPTGYKDYFLDTIQVTTEDDIVYHGSIEYRALYDDLVYTFETTGGTAHVTQSYQTVGSYVASGTAPDFGGAIGVTRDSIDGCDIVIPAFQWSETYLFLPSTVDSNYKKDLIALTGKVNNATFRECAEGEALFTGVRGSRRGYGPWELTFSFVGSPNAEDIPIGDIIVADKAGHDYLWVYYAQYSDPTQGILVKRPLAAMVERVYRRASFSGLGI